MTESHSGSKDANLGSALVHVALRRYAWSDKSCLWFGEPQMKKFLAAGIAALGLALVAGIMPMPQPREGEAVLAGEDFAAASAAEVSGRLAGSGAVRRFPRRFSRRVFVGGFGFYDPLWWPLVYPWSLRLVPPDVIVRMLRRRVICLRRLAPRRRSTGIAAAIPRAITLICGNAIRAGNRFRFHRRTRPRRRDELSGGGLHPRRRCSSSRGMISMKLQGLCR